jgi:hypothetical protein
VCWPECQNGPAAGMARGAQGGVTLGPEQGELEADLSHLGF